MKKVYIIDAKRTPVGSFLGTLKNIGPAELGGKVIENILTGSGVASEDIDEVIVGNVLSAGHGQGVGRQVAVAGGVPYEVPAYSINILCGSGMKAVMTAFNSIAAGDGNLIIAGGVESMSQAGFVAPAAIRNGHKMMDLQMTDHMIKDGLTDAFNDYHMGITAENIASKYELTREMQDEFAIGSQNKAIEAVDEDRFKEEIVPLEIKSRRETIIFDKDEYPNRKTSLEKLGTLRPAFKKDGSVTAGNASGLNDGASMVLLASEEAVQKYNLTPMAEIVAIGQGGVDPSIMGMGPVPAINNLMKKTDIDINKVELFELNEAFAAQALGVIRELSNQYEISEEWIKERCNVNGGAIALGHPIGASGNRIITTLVHEMKKRNNKYGVASLCIGGGMGTAVLLKNI